MKALLLTDGIYPFVIGGMQKHSVQLARELAHQGCKVVLLQCVYGDAKLPDNSEVINSVFSEMKDRIEICGIRFPKMLSFPGHYAIESYMYSKKAFALFYPRIKEFDFVYAQGFTGWMFSWARANGKIEIPVIVNLHGLNMFQPTFSLRSNAENIMLRWVAQQCIFGSDVLISLGGKLTNILENLKRGQQVIFESPNAISEDWPITEKNYSFSDEIRFLFIGRNDKIKGYDELRVAIVKLCERKKSFKFTIVGPFEQHEKINHENISYTGVISAQAEIRKIVQSNDILVMNSVSEGMPTVMLEAMTCGLALISTDVGAVSEILDSTNGWLMKNNSSETVLKTLEQAINCGHDEIREKGKNSIKKITEKYSWEKVVRALLNFVEFKFGRKIRTT